RRQIRELFCELVYVELVVVTHVPSTPFASPPSWKIKPHGTAGRCHDTQRVYNPRVSRSTDRGHAAPREISRATWTLRGPSAAPTRSPVSSRPLVASPTTPDAVMSRSMSIGTTTPGPLCVMPYLPNDVHGKPASRTAAPRS